MKELFVQFNFNVRVEVEDIDDVEDEVITWWTSTVEIPDYKILEKEEE